MVNLTEALCLEAIGALEEAARLLLKHNHESRARRCLTGISPEAYGLVLNWYDKTQPDRLYFLARYVLSSTECDPAQRPAQEYIDRYRAGLLSPATPRPKRATVNNRSVVIDWEQLEDDPLE